MQYPQKILRYTLDIIFPIKCLGCAKLGEGKKLDYLCKSCLASIPINRRWHCIGCQMVSPLGQTCLRCTKSIAIDQVLFMTDYANPLVEKMIKTYKYRFIFDLKSPLFYLSKKFISILSKGKHFNLIEDSPLFTSVPLDRTRENWRGFNQSSLLSEMIAKSLNLNFNDKILLKESSSIPQAEIEDKESRMKNLENKFKINDDLKLENKTVIIFDDIVTTGTTLNECAKILKASGAKKVIGLTIARG